MKALVVKALGDPTLPPSSSGDGPLMVDDLPRPTLSSPTQVRVRVAAASVNFATVLTIKGVYQERPALPFVPGGDFSGVVVEIGRNVRRVKIGDRVCGVVDLGSYAEELVTEEENVYVVGGGVDLVASAGLPVAFGTSHVGLVHRAALQAGQVLLVLGAAGGVGLAAVQIGKICGAIVIAAARGKEKVEMVRSMGADFVVDTETESVLKSVGMYLKKMKLKGVDVVYDPVGGKLFREAMKLCKWGGQILVIGFASGEIPNIPANILLVKNLTVHGLYWGSYKTHKPHVLEESMNKLIEWMANDSLHIQVSHRFPLSQAYGAFAGIVNREVIGKVMIVMNEDDVDVLQSKL